MTGSSSLWETFLLPPLLSLALYLLLSYLLIPLYHRHRGRYSSYIPLPLQSATTSLPSLPSRVLAQLLPSRFGLGRRRSSDESGTSLFGEEELEEGLVPRVGGGGAHEGGDGERRLSRELEVGFRDESDSGGEESDERGRTRTGV
ncbi:hypothetical protein MMC08_002418 [Hypocenomyce scalaris]|nr:hypothetical protein [Hypocenomyce scalaris]